MLKKALEDEINEKRIYCQRQANREFFGSSPAGIRQEGYLDEVDGLTPETLTEAYREMLRTASIELLVLGCGEAETEQVKQALLEELSHIGRAPLPLCENLAMPRQDAVRRVECFDTVQAKLCMLFTLGVPHAPRPDGGGAACHGAVWRQCDQPPVPERAGTGSFVLLLLVQLPEALPGAWL